MGLGGGGAVAPRPPRGGGCRPRKTRRRRAPLPRFPFAKNKQCKNTKSIIIQKKITLRRFSEKAPRARGHGVRSPRGPPHAAPPTCAPSLSFPPPISFLRFFPSSPFPLTLIENQRLHEARKQVRLLSSSILPSPSPDNRTQTARSQSRPPTSTSTSIPSDVIFVRTRKQSFSPINRIPSL